MNVFVGDPDTCADIWETVWGGEEVHVFEACDMHDLLVTFGFFPSKRAAAGAGWDKEIPWGLNDWTIGRKRRELWVWKP